MTKFIVNNRTAWCACKYMMYRVCLFMSITFVYEKIVCNFESIKINKIQKKKKKKNNRTAP